MKKPFVFFVALIFLFATLSVAIAEEDATLNETATTESKEIANETAETISEIENETAEGDKIANEIENETREDVVEVLATENETEAPEELASKEQEEIAINETVENETAAPETPAITPDNTFLWGLKRAFERIDLLITFGKSAKAQKGLKHARERLLEVQAMIAAKKLEAAEKAAEAYKKSIDEVEKNVEGIGNGNASADLSDVQKIAEQIKLQGLQLQQLQNKIKLSTQNMTTEQKTAVYALISSLKDSENSMRVSAEQKRNKIEVKIKAKAVEERARIETRAEEGSEKSSGKELKNQTRSEERVQKITRARNETQIKGSR